MEKPSYVGKQYLKYISKGIVTLEVLPCVHFKNCQILPNEFNEIVSYKMYVRLILLIL